MNAISTRPMMPTWQAKMEKYKLLMVYISGHTTWIIMSDECYMYLLI